MQQWVEEVKHLSSIAQTQPHAAYFHGLCNKWTYLSRTIPNTEELNHVYNDGARLDIAANGFSGEGLREHFLMLGCLHNESEQLEMA